MRVAVVEQGPGRRRRWGSVAVSAVAVIVLGACGGAADPRGTAQEAPTTPPVSPAPVWPDPARTVLVPASGEGTPLGEYERYDLTAYAEQNGEDLARVLAIYQHQDDFATFTEAVRARYADRFSGASFTSSEGDPAWVAFTEDVPEGVEALAQGLPLDVELRGGALLTEGEVDLVTSRAMQAFADDVRTEGWSGGVDAQTAHFTITYLPADDEEADDATAAAVVAAARAALGRDVPFTVDFVPDRTDPTDTEPATWFLPAGFVADPTATSVEVLVEEQGCSSGRGAEGNTAEPTVEVTDGQVLIGVSTYVRRGPQTCPGHPLAPLVVDLVAPLGDRTLVDVNGRIDDDRALPGADLLVPPVP